jgi:hypothetical protein
VGPKVGLDAVVKIKIPTPPPPGIEQDNERKKDEMGYIYTAHGIDEK